MSETVREGDLRVQQSICSSVFRSSRPNAASRANTTGIYYSLRNPGRNSLRDYELSSCGILSNLLFRIGKGRFPNWSGMSGMDGSVEELNATEVDSQSFLRFSPTSVSTGAAAAAYGRTANVYVYISIFLSLLLFLLTLLIIALHRLKNIISSSSSYPECSSEAGSSFTNMEICSISSQRSTVSSLS